MKAFCSLFVDCFTHYLLCTSDVHTALTHYSHSHFKTRNFLLSSTSSATTTVAHSPLNLDLMFANSLFMRFSSASLLLPTDTRYITWTSHSTVLTFFKYCTQMQQACYQVSVDQHSSVPHQSRGARWFVE